MNTSTPPHTPFPAAGTAEGRFVVPLSTLPPTAGISFEEQQQQVDSLRRAKRCEESKESYRRKIENLKTRPEEYEKFLQDRRAKSKAKYQLEKDESKKYYQSNRTYILTRSKKRYEAKAQEICQKRKERRKSNPHGAIASERRRSKKRYQHTLLKLSTDPLFRLTCCLRNRLRAAFKSQRAEKTKSTRELTGCNRDELRQHLASQFREGMTLENHGKVWHIDHIRPCASFDLSDPNQAILCFHYSNLQPLFADENIRKGDRWEPMEIRPLAA